MRNYLIAIVLAFLLWLWPEALGFAVFAMLAPPLCDSSCCATCTIFSDDFATDRTGTDYTTVSGTFSVSGGEIATSSTGGALIVEDTAGATGHGRVTVSGQASATGSKVGVVGSYVNSSSYLWAELTLNGGSSTFKLWDKSGPTQIGITHTFSASLNTYYSLEVCWNGTKARAVITVAGTTYIISGDYTGTGNQAGMIATQSSGSSKFDNFTFSKHSKDDSSCSLCGGDDANFASCNCPTMKLAVSGVANATGCGNCAANLNGDDEVNFSTGLCQWQNSILASACVFGIWAVDITVAVVSGDYILTVYISVNDFGTFKDATFIKNMGTVFDCWDLVDEAIPFDSQSGANNCDWTGASLLLTSRPYNFYP